MGEPIAKKARTEAQDVPVHRIVITGGPCGGKTSAMTVIKERLEKIGWRVFTVPEAATILFRNGARFEDFLKTGRIADFQTQIGKLQLRLECTMSDVAISTGHKSVVLCDRGLMDGKAYCSPEAWAMVLDGLDQTELQLRDQRYDAVIHLTSAGKDAPQYYTLEQAEGGESVRRETVAEAACQDDKTRSAWKGHAHLHLIESRTDFSNKMDRAADCVLECIGETVQGR